MADRKNQHLVPRALLKPWTLNAGGKALNLYNLRSDRGVQNAALRNQCSRDYFYGADLQIETWLGRGEGIYAQTVAGLPSQDANITAASLEILRDFTYLQAIRTERSIREEANILRGMYDEVFDEVIAAHEPMPDHETIVREAFERWHTTSQVLRDLKGAILINETEADFLISDDPAIHTNRLHTQKLKSVTFGIQQSGIILIMPLSPTLAVIFYDGEVYTLPDKRSFNVIVKDIRSVDAINELQFISGGQNIYFRFWSDLEKIRATFREVSDRRLEVHHRLNILVPKAGEENAFVVAPKGEGRVAGRSIVHIESISPNPRNWPSQLKFRADASGFSDGSAMGYIRRSHALAQGLTAKNKIRF